MSEPLTEELLDELLSTSSIDSYLDQHQPGSRTLAEYLQQLLAEKGLERSRVVRMANLNDTFGVYAKLGNILCQKYELYYGYPMQGFNAMIGVNINF